MGVCRRCGGAFTAKKKGAAFCSRACYAGWHNRRGAGLERAAHALPRSQRLAIFDRDHWICYLCGFPLNKDCKAPDPPAPTVDHIVPIAAHGPHDASNLGAAHLRCNIEKGDDLPSWWQRPAAFGEAAHLG
jgi:5-methylcytosine-specific restriction endonuclease McrA